MNAGKFRVSAELLKEVLSLPDDVIILGIDQNLSDQTLLFYAASSVFPEVAEGARIIDELRPTVHVEWCEHGGIMKRWTEWSK